jgi:hypothetical protein
MGPTDEADRKLDDESFRELTSSRARKGRLFCFLTAPEAQFAS